MRFIIDVMVSLIMLRVMVCREVEGFLFVDGLGFKKREVEVFLFVDGLVEKGKIYF